MICAICHNETDSASLFCHVCDVYRPDPNVGKKANVGLRLLALLIDTLVAYAIFTMIAAISCGLAGTLGMASNARNSQNAVTAGAVGLGTFLVAVIGYVIFLLWFLARGKTPGKAMTGLRVADKRNGSLPGMARMLLRETLGKFISGLVLAVGYLWAIFDRDSQAWHDKIAGTVVLKNNHAVGRSF